jgi:hypothetical protein
MSEVQLILFTQHGMADPTNAMENLAYQIAPP